MEKLVNSAVWLNEHGAEVVSAVIAMLSGLIAVFMLIPGDEPEATLQKIVDFLSKFSKK